MVGNVKVELIGPVSCSSRTRGHLIKLVDNIKASESVHLEGGELLCLAVRGDRRQTVSAGS